MNDQRLNDEAYELVKYGLSDSYVESRLWANRRMDISMEDIKNSIVHAKEKLKKEKHSQELFV
jgi:hypothetical protein